MSIYLMKLFSTSCLLRLRRLPWKLWFGSYVHRRQLEAGKVLPSATPPQPNYQLQRTSSAPF